MGRAPEPTLGADLAVFGACADLTRLRILFLLAARQLCVCELVEVLQMPQGKVSRHLLVLRSAGLVHARREGTWMHYSLVPGTRPLTRRLNRYLQDVAVGLPQADRQRLAALAGCGRICCRRAKDPGPRRGAP